MQAPIADKRPFVHTQHGVERPDPYHWLRDREDPSVIAYIEEENAYTASRTEHLGGLQESVYAEMRGRIQEARTTAPVPRGDWVYYARYLEGANYAQHCRRPRTGGDEQVVLDENVLAEGKEYTSVAVVSVSPDQTKVAYAIDHSGAERYAIVVKDLTTGALVDTALVDVDCDVTWSADSDHLLYCTFDETQRPDSVWLHAVGTDRTTDARLYHEPDSRFRVGHKRSLSNRFLMLFSVSSQTTEVHLIPADAPTVTPRCVQPRHAGMRYWVDHAGDWLWIHTNDSDDPDGTHNEDCINFKLMKAPIESTSRTEWVEVLGHRAEVELKWVSCFADHLVLFEREAGLPHLSVFDLHTEQSRRIALDEACYDLNLYLNMEFDGGYLLFSYNSMVTPSSVIRHDFATGENTVISTVPVPTYDASLYTSQRIVAEAEDGTSVPISLVYRKDIGPGPRKLLLYGYGSYGLTVDASFNQTRISLLDRGVVYAIAHIRGGGLMGRNWYESAKFLNKKRTFTDFIDCAKHLVNTGWTTPDRMAIMGGSAGGMLMGAVVNMAPELFHCCVAQVPFVDVVNTMFDASLPLTTNEWEEWGNPQERSFFDYMISYSPYDNVVDTDAFPHLLIVSGLNDPRVQYWEPTKWCARLRATQTHRQELLLRTNMGAGHSGASGRFGYIKERAQDYAWVLDKLGAAERL